MDGCFTQVLVHSFAEHLSERCSLNAELGAGSKTFVGVGKTGMSLCHGSSDAVGGFLNWQAWVTYHPYLDE